MLSIGEDKQISYEDGLRIIGRHLDCEPSYHVSVVEGADGFSVRWQPTLHQTDALVETFDRPRLTDLAVFNSAGRDVRRRAYRHQGMWNSLPCGHEDALRALGFILDAENASDISLDEVPEGLSVSYVRSQSGSDRSEKVHRIYDVKTMERLCTEALARRRARHQPAAV